MPGLLLALALALVATGFGRVVPVVGAPVVAIVLGIAVRTLLDRRGAVTPRLAAGASLAGRYVLQAAIVCFGAQLSLRTVATVGVRSLPVMLGTLALCLAAGWVFGRALGVADPLRTLVTVGTAICGASAIAAATGVLRAGQATVAYAISTIVVYNVTAAVLFPPIGHLLGLSQHGFGLWAGTAVNDMSSVVAAAYSYGHEAGEYAVVVKLTRALMIIPVVLGLAALAAHRAPAGARQPVWRLVPAFLPLFLAAAALNSLGLIPAGWHRPIGLLAEFGVAVALAGIGLGTRLGDLRTAGLRPVALGGLLSVTVAGGSLALQAMTGSLS